MCQAEQLTALMLLRCESLRLALARVGAAYRQFFAFLYRLTTRLDEHRSAQAQAAAAIRVSPQALIAFLEGQFQKDAIGPELQSIVSTYPMVISEVNPN